MIARTVIARRRDVTRVGVGIGRYVVSGDDDGDETRATVRVVAYTSGPYGVIPIVRYADGSESFGVGDDERLRPAIRRDRA